MMEEKIKKYYEYEQKIKQNHINNEKIEEVTIQINSFESELKPLTEKHKISLSEVAIARVEKERTEQDIQKLIEIEQKILDYDLYLMLMSKDGIPYELISKAIPSIQAEINEVLDAMMVGFTITLEMEGTNVNTYICYGEDSWSLELASGMEKFVSSLAIRVGLINVSTLPRPNFLCLDEGFGSLDGENIANMESAFNYLKTQFDFVLIITHLDAIKDYMNHLISIDINDGYSKIIFA
jgi:DNA repair exonuclease SbcCD ATPase subunit